MPVASGYTRPSPSNWLGKKVLISTDNYFYAPDGNSYKAAHGTLIGILSDKETLGIPTNSRSTNWYIQLGGLLIAGCQIHYAILCDEVDYTPMTLENWHEGKLLHAPSDVSRIYNADQ